VIFLNSLQRDLLEWSAILVIGFAAGDIPKMHKPALLKGASIVGRFLAVGFAMSFSKEKIWAIP